MASSLKFSMAQSTTATHPKAAVYVAIDTSSSMQGTKIAEVKQALQRIISNVPNYVRFVIRTFDTQVITLVSKKKKYLDVKRMKSDIIIGGMTALYDGWGQTINEIPYGCSKLDLVHVLVFTDGEDNASKNYTLDSVMKLTKEKIIGKMQFTFIQAGSNSVVLDAIRSQCNSDHFSVKHVSDSADAIKIAFTEAADRIRIQFEIKVTPDLDSNLAQITAQMGAIQTGFSSGNRSYLGCSRNTPSPFGTHQTGSPNGKKSYLGRNTPTRFDGPQLGCSGGKKSYSGRNTPIHFGGPQQGCSQGTKSYSSRNTPTGATLPKVESKPANLSKQQIYVGKIPARFMDGKILEFFLQWGECNLDLCGMISQKEKFAIITYMNEVSKRNALKYGSSASFHGSILHVVDMDTN